MRVFVGTACVCVCCDHYTVLSSLLHELSLKLLSLLLCVALALSLLQYRRLGCWIPSTSLLVVFNVLTWYYAPTQEHARESRLSGHTCSLLMLTNVSGFTKYHIADVLQTLYYSPDKTFVQITTRHLRDGEHKRVRPNSEL